jgi:hypothetical protein
MPTILFCVGATKAGTSWLYRHLSQHPDCHMRTIKELHYFDMLEHGTQRRFRTRLRERIALLKSAIAAGDARPAQQRQLRDAVAWKDVIGAEGINLTGYMGYLCEGRGGKPLVADITPAYALLPEARLQQMAAIAPQTRFLYLLRDPVSRLWSQARMLASRRSVEPSDFAALASQMLEGMLEAIRNGLPDREDYIGAVTRLRNAIAPDRLMIQLQDEMMSPPGLSRLHRFLGIADVPGEFDRRVHEGTPLALPDDLRARAQAALRPQYEYVARLIPELPESWRKNMTEVHG